MTVTTRDYPFIFLGAFEVPLLHLMVYLLLELNLAARKAQCHSSKRMTKRNCERGVTVTTGNTPPCLIEATWLLFGTCLLFGSCHSHKYEPCLLFGSIVFHNEACVLFGLC